MVASVTATPTGETPLDCPGQASDGAVFADALPRGAGARIQGAVSLSDRSGPSRLTLGTAQIGLDYGIANRNGKPDAAAAEAILDRAWQAGITCFDTARAYGDAETRLGRWLAKGHASATVISKFPRLGEGAAGAAVRAAFERSCTVLCRSRLDAYLAHGTDDLHRPGVADALRALRDEGRLAAFGASVYTPEEAFAALRVDGLSVLQVPLSVFNRRMIHGGVLAACSETGVAVFARSVFVQGLVFLAPEALPDFLGPARGAVARFRMCAAAHGLSPAALALGAVLAEPEVTSVVVGAETVDQVDEIVAVEPLDRSTAAEVVSAFADEPAHLFDPSRWPTS
jgi:aryl-alcohol dehydrogenase-like predicted oxidoreductase